MRKRLIAATIALAITFTLSCKEENSGKTAEAAQTEQTTFEAEVAKAEAIKAAAEAEAAANEPVSCGNGGGNVKLLECLTDAKGEAIKKFEYDDKNRLVEIYERYSGTVTITYNTDDLITVKKGSDTEKLSRNGNTITVELNGKSNTSITVNEDGFIEYIEGNQYKYKGGNLVEGDDCEYSSYDNKNSPLFNTSTPKWLLQRYRVFASKNNVLSEYCSGGEITFTNKNKYKYDSEGFPTKRTQTSYVEGEEGSETILYTYYGNKTGADAGGAFKDSRDGKSYKTAKIGNQTWMAENLNYEMPNGNSWCYDNSSENCNKYGRLYDWETATKACPKDWHLSSVREWKDLVTTVGDNTAGIVLRATSGWDGGGNGTDAFGFSALPGGTRTSISIGYYDTTITFDFVGKSGFWWTSTPKDAEQAFSRNITSYNGGERISSIDNAKKAGFSVRCVKNKENEQ